MNKPTFATMNDYKLIHVSRKLNNMFSMFFSNIKAQWQSQWRCWMLCVPVVSNITSIPSILNSIINWMCQSNSAYMPTRSPEGQSTQPKQVKSPKVCRRFLFYQHIIAFKRLKCEEFDYERFSCSQSFFSAAFSQLFSYK